MKNLTKLNQTIRRIAHLMSNDVVGMKASVGNRPVAVTKQLAYQR